MKTLDLDETGSAKGSADIRCSGGVVQDQVRHVELEGKRGWWTVSWPRYSHLHPPLKREETACASFDARHHDLLAGHRGWCRAKYDLRATVLVILAIFLRRSSRESACCGVACFEVVPIAGRKPQDDPLPVALVLIGTGTERRRRGGGRESSCWGF